MFRGWCWFIWIATAVSVLIRGPMIGELIMLLIGNTIIYILPVWLFRLAYRRWQRAKPSKSDTSIHGGLLALLIFLSLSIGGRVAIAYVVFAAG